MDQAPKADRYKSILADFIIILIITILLLNSTSSLANFIAILVPLVYFPILHTLLSRSIGDILFNLKIVDQQGKKIGFQSALNRFVLAFKYYIFSLVFLNLLFWFLLLFRGNRDIRDVSVDYEGESRTYLVKSS